MSYPIWSALLIGFFCLSKVHYSLESISGKKSIGMLHFFILHMYIMIKGLKCCITLLLTVLTVDKLF